MLFTQASRSVAGRERDHPQPAEPPAVTHPPRAVPVPVVDTLFDFTATDPYRWMEEWQSTESQAWLHAQATYADQVLAALPERAALLQRLDAIAQAGTARGNFRVAGERLFYLRRPPHAQVAQLVTRTRAEATEQVLFDPGARAGGETHQAIDWFVPAPDGQRIAVGVSPGGSEDSTLLIIEVATGAVCDPPIPHARFGGVHWLREGTGFLYKRYTPPDSARAAAWAPSYVYLHRLGDDPTQDRPILAPGTGRGVRWGPADHAQVVAHGPWLIGWVQTGEEPRMRLYRARRAGLDHPQRCHWEPIAGLRADIRQFFALGDRLYLLRPGCQGHGEVVVTSLAEPDLEYATTVVEESAAVIRRFWLQGGQIFLLVLVDGLPELRHLDTSSGVVTRVVLPGTVHSAIPEGPGVLLEISGWTTPPAVYRYSPGSTDLEDTGWCPPYPVTMRDISVTRIQVQSRDGVAVPLTILALPTAGPSGPRPTILTAYGAYGQPLLPVYNPLLRPWLERGGIVAIAHVRGGGEYGVDWHRSGQKARKQRGIADVIRCAEYLIAESITAPDRLALEGHSAGGVVCAGAVVQRPDLWAAVILRQTVLDMLRYEQGANGPANVPEFGTRATPRGARSLRAMDPYSALRSGVRYPPMLALVGINDPRVPIWHAMKWVARVQDAADGYPGAALLRVDFQGGHGQGATTARTLAELADRYAFVLDASNRQSDT